MVCLIFYDVMIQHQTRNQKKKKIKIIFDRHFFCSQKMMLMARLTNISLLIRKVKKGPKYGIMSGCASIKRKNSLRYL